MRILAEGSSWDQNQWSRAEAAGPQLCKYILLEHGLAHSYTYNL